MSRTDLDATTLANSLRMRAGDGSIEWVSEPIQASVLLDIADMLDENAKLVDVLHEVEAEAVYAYHCLQQDCVTTANSSEHFFKKWWHAECELDRLNAENAKLRELVQDFDKCLTEAERLAYIQGHATIYDGTLLDSLHPRMRELGVEVSDA